MKERIFKEITNSNVAQWLGFIAADGSINGGQLQIGLSSKDKEHLEKFRVFLETEKEVKDRLNKCREKLYPTSQITIGSVLLTSDLRHYQIIENKSQSDVNFLENIPDEYKSDFIVGYFDGDGWYTNTEKSLSFGFCGNFNTISAINSWLEQNLDIKINVRRDHDSEITYDICTSNKKQINRFIDFYLSKKQIVDLLERKYQTALNIKSKLELYLDKEKNKQFKEKAQRLNLVVQECPICKEKFIPKFKGQTFCSQECSHKDQQRTERPNREKLKELIRNKPFLYIGKQFNVTDNAIRKWCKAYNLPYTKKEINSYSDKEWEKI